MKTLIIRSVIAFALIGAGLLSVKQSIQCHKRAELRELRYKVALKYIYKKYKWKSDRLKVYTGLVYNVKYGAVYEKKK